MQIKYSLMLPILFSLGSCASTKAVSDCKKCSVEISVKTISESNITEEIIEKLFCTAADSCQVNAEFMEAFNEALFVCLEKKPDIFVQQFSLSARQDLVLQQLESPVNDTIHLQKIIEQLTKMPKPKNADAYDKILQALNVAEKKKQ